MNLSNLLPLVFLAISSFNFAAFPQNTDAKTIEEATNLVLAELKQTATNSLLRQAASYPNYALTWYFVDAAYFPGCGKNYSYQKSTANFKKAADFNQALALVSSSELSFEVHAFTRLKRLSDGKEFSMHLWQARFCFNQQILAWEYRSVDRYVCCRRNTDSPGFTYECPSMKWSNGLFSLSWDDDMTIALKGEIVAAAIKGQ